VCVWICYIGVQYRCFIKNLYHLKLHIPAPFSVKKFSPKTARICANAAYFTLKNDDVSKMYT